MMSQQYLTLLAPWFSLVLLSCIEWGCLGFWVPGYMRTGIPVYVRRISDVRKKHFWTLSEELPAIDFRSFWYPATVFKLLKNNEIAFRHKFLSLDIGLGNQKPFRGMIRFNQDEQSIIISGFLPFFEPFYAIIILWGAWYFARDFINLFPDESGPFSSVQMYLKYIVFMLILIRGLLALSYFKFSNRLVEILTTTIEELEI